MTRPIQYQPEAEPIACDSTEPATLLFFNLDKRGEVFLRHNGRKNRAERRPFQNARRGGILMFVG